MMFADDLETDCNRTARFARVTAHDGRLQWQRVPRSPLPSGWQDWARHERSSPGGKRFVRWAEPAPDDGNASRFAIAEDDHLPPGSGSRVVWLEVSPNPDVPPRQSGGCFYSDAGAEGAYCAAESAAWALRARRGNHSISLKSCSGADAGRPARR